VECAGGAGERPLEVLCQGGGHVEGEDLVGPFVGLEGGLVVVDGGGV
jgi:hypothetical protein